MNETGTINDLLINNTFLLFEFVKIHTQLLMMNWYSAFPTKTILYI